MKITLILGLTAVVLFASTRILRADAPARGEAAVVTLISIALAHAKSQAPEEQFETLQVTARSVLQACPNNWLISKKLHTALDDSKSDIEKHAQSLQNALSESAEILNFRMKKEADLPKDFPEPTQLGEICLKHYPAHRLARVQSKNDSAFLTLFNHIKSNKIEMTAPVEMRFDEAEQKYQQIDMAFLYGAPDWGQLGDSGKGVTVEDIPAMSTVAIGLTGDFDPNATTYIDALEAWLAQHAIDYERDGKVRVMGYNSPFVWKSQRFFEIEIPVKKRANALTAESYNP